MMGQSPKLGGNIADATFIKRLRGPFHAGIRSMSSIRSVFSDDAGDTVKCFYRVRLSDDPEIAGPVNWLARLSSLKKGGFVFITVKGPVFFAILSRAILPPRTELVLAESRTSTLSDISSESYIQRSAEIDLTGFAGRAMTEYSISQWQHAKQAGLNDAA